jgi:hypothetical protein
MLGMEIFNVDDLSDDFLEIDDNLLSGKSTDTEPVKPAKENNKPKEIKEDEDDVDNEDEGLDLIIPPSLQSDNDEDIEPDSSTLSPKFFSSLVQALKEGGVLADVEEKDVKTQEDFLKIIDDSVKKREFEDLNDDQKEYLEALRTGIPHERIAQHQQTEADYASITDEALEDESDDGENLRRNVIMVNYMTKGISEAKAKKLTDKIVESGEDIAEAKDAIVELKAAEKAAFEAEKQGRVKQREAQVKAEKDAMESLNKIVKDMREIVPGLPIPINVKNKIIKELTQPVAYTEDKRPLDRISKYLHDNPIEGRVKLAYLLEVTDNFKKMDVLENKKAKKQIFKGLEEALKFKESGGKLEDEDKFQSKFDLDKWEF